MVRNIYIVLASLLLAVALHQAVPAYAETAVDPPGGPDTSPAAVQQTAPASNDDTSPAAVASDNTGLEPVSDEQTAPVQDDSAKPAAEASGAADPDILMHNGRSRPPLTTPAPPIRPRAVPT